MIRISPQSNFFAGTIDFWLVEESGFHGEKRSIGQPVVMQSADGLLAPEPTFKLEQSAAEELFERLWALGFRSRHDKGNADKLDQARQEHLADLRKAAKL